MSTTNWNKSKLWIVTVTFLVITAFMGNAVVSADEQSAVAANKEIVNPYQTYTYDLMSEDVKKLAAAYPDLIQVKSIGTTAYGKDIKAVKLGKGEANVLIDGAQHAREWMGTNLILYMIDRYAYAYEHNMKFNEYVVRELLNRCSIWFIPMVNPDGVTLQQLGPSAFPEELSSQFISMNGGSNDFNRWKANAEGIDINRQYPADWTGIRNASKYPMYKNYKGAEPVVTAEAKSMIRFTYESDPEIALSYHTSGRVLYWNFHTDSKNLERDRKMAETISGMTGYSLVMPETNPSGGGYTDWFIAQFGRPGFTAELGPYIEEAELPIWTFSDIWKENETLGLYLASEGYKLWQQRYPIETVENKLQLLETVKLYNRPSESFPTGGEISSGKVSSDARMGEWYRLSTWMGSKWIHLDETAYLQGYSEKFVQLIDLKDVTPLYKYPIAENMEPIGKLNPQQVNTLERWRDWVLIHTWMGDVWIPYKE
ncbi:gamma-D-glutamyl-meso-diaminopimelate peptidase [Paenibacillus sp. SYP-B3998]|uniref:Gamma-D-glutamyl-meso-diaminopimelate peptidase n=1 Tax=Paenibacillus sp. SYP-B3998 TaxID=2678564 RepID=A0A6G3ZU75_9BACL|nr:M14 family zinc carboxypeptidase [Paenibacillus sp. SYP-B3998]NEW04967.1 gamma-D-glutamyl-meso-diaminopimelate peptidase [Paenibacillus sp. SYP-B3998]